MHGCFCSDRQEKLQLAFDKIQLELAKLKLVLNASKTKVMLFSKARHFENIDPDSLLITSANGTQIERVPAYKYLGLWLDQKLTFQLHIDQLAAKLRQKVGFLYRNRSSFPVLESRLSRPHFCQFWIMGMWFTCTLPPRPLRH